MFAWISTTKMIVADAEPIICIVTFIALNTCLEMVDRFARRCLAIMTGITRPGNGIMIETGRDPSEGQMTVVALRIGCNVRGRFSGGCGAVVARIARP